MIRILSPGLGCAVQDLGRTGLGNIGVGCAGAMDRRAMQVANAMLGNPLDAAGLELTLGGLSFEVLKPITIALTGADVQATVDDRILPRWWARSLQPGQVFRSRPSSTGMRSYLAIAGGIDVPLVLGSRSTDAKGGFGGMNGRGLQTDDTLTAFPAPRHMTKVDFGLSPRIWPDLWQKAGAPSEIRFIPAAEWQDYSTVTQALFCSTEWRIEPASNRIGYRLAGPQMRAECRRELLSHGIIPGTIQLPPSGYPVIQMLDANTLGGYPKLGVVADADLPRLAQATLGSTLRFTIISPKLAQVLRCKQDNMIAAISRITRFQREE